MTNKKRHFDQAKKQFESNELLNYYLTLLEAGENDFITKGIEKGYFDYSDFWVGFLSEEDHFTTFFNAKYADELIFYYFNRSKIRSTDFEQQLASKFPQLFVNGVRQTQAFLQSERLPQLLAVKLPDEHQVHQKVWEWLYQQDTQRWNKVILIWDQLKSDSLSNHLINVLIWLEHRYFEDDSDQHLQQLSIVYNCFVSLLMEQFESSELDVTEDEFYQSFHDSAFRRRENPLAIVLNEINDWVSFNESITVQYSYDLNVSPVWKDNSIIDFTYISKEAHLKWIKGDFLYQNNRQRYFESEVERYYNKLIIGEIKVPFESNSMERELHVDVELKLSRSIRFLEDLKTENLILSKKQVPVESILQPLLEYSTNRLYRYARVLEKYRSIFPKWEQAYYKVIEENASKSIDVEPYFLMSRKEYVDLNLNVLKETSPEVLEDLIDLFGSQAKWQEFNRHSVRYDVWNRPFLRIGEMLFCPMLFFAKNDWFYGFAQTAIQNLSQKSNFVERKRTAILMEEHLGSLFSEKGWRVKVITDQETSRMKGDIDVFVEDGTTQLLIQLKRTYFRTTLKDAFYESVQSDRKAAQQLNDGVDFLKVDSSIFQLKTDPVKWIVSTSFENILTEIDGCLKVNYLDLIWMLRNEEFGLLKELIDDINGANCIAYE